MTEQVPTSSAPAEGSTGMFSWSSDNQRRMETVRTVLTDRGLRANGYIIQSGPDGYGASYSVLVDAEGRTRRLSVQSDSGNGERHLSLTRTPDGPWVLESTAGSHPRSEIDEALDIDLVSSTFTNSLTLRRVGLLNAEPGTSETVTVARISLPLLTVEPVQVTYTLEKPGVVSYQGPLGDHLLSVDESGFIQGIPGLGHRLT